MKDGRTRLAHKAEHAVDLETGAVVGVSVQDADAADTATMIETLVIAAEQVATVQPAGTGIAELVCNNGYHSNQALVTLAAPMPFSTPCCSHCAASGASYLAQRCPCREIGQNRRRLTHDAVSFTQSARAARRQFCHSLLGADRRCSRGK